MGADAAVDGPRRWYGPALVVGLLGGIGMTVGGSRPWATATSTVAGLPTLHATATGTDLAPVAAALGVVVLAAFGAVIATRGRVRQALGALVVLASLVVLAASIHPGSPTAMLRSGLAAKGWNGGAFDTSTTAWRWLVLVSAVASVAAGVATCVYGARWPVMGSRYDAPAAVTPAAERPPEQLTDTEVWQAIDHGIDPTQGP